MLGSWLVTDGIVISAESECPALDPSRYHGGNAPVLSQDVLEWPMVGLNGEFPAVQVLMEAFDPENYG